MNASTIVLKTLIEVARDPSQPAAKRDMAIREARERLIMPFEGLSHAFMTVGRRIGRTRDAFEALRAATEMQWSGAVEARTGCPDPGAALREWLEPATRDGFAWRTRLWEIPVIVDDSVPPDTLRFLDRSGTVIEEVRLT